MSSRKARESKSSSAIAYRIPMEVSTIRVLGHGAGASCYPVCPKCDCTLEREYQLFCDRCGQALSWKRLNSAAVIRNIESPPRRPRARANKQAEN